MNTKPASQTALRSMSEKRKSQLELLLRRLRQRAFDCERCAALIPAVKARLAPEWKSTVRDYHWMYAAE